jgi:dihydrofolate reductase
MRTDLSISIIVAHSMERVIGKGNTIPWKIPSDLKRFRNFTKGHPVIMGRRNWESIPEKYRPLPHRTNIVMTRQKNLTEKIATGGALVVDSIEGALKAAAAAIGSEEIFVIGGEDIYRQFLPLATKCYVTYVLASVEGDVHFPELEKAEWTGNFMSELPTQGPDDEYPTAFQAFARRVHL